jgi:hypothetical protein
MEEAIKDLEMISYHLRDTDQIFVSNWIDRCVETIKQYGNERV